MNGLISRSNLIVFSHDKPPILPTASTGHRSVVSRWNGFHHLRGKCRGVVGMKIILIAILAYVVIPLLLVTLFFSLIL